MPPLRALVTGATGAVGSPLVPRLLDGGWSVRVLTRDSSALDARWAGRVDVVEGDATSTDVLTRAVKDVDAAWYLIHSMASTYDYPDQDRRIAEGFGTVCREAGVSRIVYLGGLLPDGDLTPHLESRRDVGRALVDSGVPTAVLQAGIVVGHGSVSFELLARAATLPIVVGPDWLAHRVQPIAMADVLHYLVGAADLPAEVSRSFDIGGPDVLSYRELIGAFAEAIGRRPPPVVTVPVLLPRTMALWAGLLAPGPTSLASSLVASLRLDMVCCERDIVEHVSDPPGGLTDFRSAVAAAHAS